MNANTRLGAEGLVGTDSHADIHKTELDPVCPGSEKPPPPPRHTAVFHFTLLLDSCVKVGTLGPVGGGGS